MKMSLKKIAKALLLTTFSGAMLLTTAHANNPPPTIKADAPNRYIVKKGDTLWDIAATHLGDGARYSDVFDVNVGVPQADGHALTDPDLILPGQVLRVPPGGDIAKPKPKRREPTAAMYYWTPLMKPLREIVTTISSSAIISSIVKSR